MASLLDIRTLTFSSAVTVTVMFMVLVYFQRTRTTYPGFGLWTLGALSMALGLALALVTLRGMIPDLLSIVAANTLLMLDIVFVLRGLAAFVGLRRPPWPDITLVTAVTATVAWFTYIQPNVNARVVVFSVAYSWFFLRTARAAAGPVAEFLGSRNWLFIAALGIEAVFFALRALRALLTLAQISSPSDFMSSTPLQVLTMALSSATHIVVVTCLVLLTAQRLEKDLAAAKGEVKILSGLLPICASCKRIRDEQGGWQPLESYISGRSQAEFTHGICPECLREHYPEVAAGILKK